ncbi:hypothetical protein B0J12DRAFT_585524 [Macrophomina phaseolina]|nr:hypothetical protein B0J12DRAFT_585524 [Macrophomina phaseolina]
MQLLASSNRVKRGLDEDPDVTGLKRRRSTTSSTGQGALQIQDLSDEDRLLLKLKDEEGLPWKDIAARFQTDMGKTYQIPALQMRLKRLRERLRVWTDADMKALRMAHDYWRDSKFEIIAAKMMEFGASDKWTAKQVARKWAEMDPSATPFMTAQEEPQQAGFSYTASPEGSSNYMPYMHMP